MKGHYDFSKGKRGAVIPLEPGKMRINIKLDIDLVDWFANQVDKAGRGSYQTMMNDVLRAHVNKQNCSA